MLFLNRYVNSIVHSSLSTSLQQFISLDKILGVKDSGIFDYYHYSDYSTKWGMIGPVARILGDKIN